jgi:hypothetical protein
LSGGLERSEALPLTGERGEGLLSLMGELVEGLHQREADEECCSYGPGK